MKAKTLLNIALVAGFAGCIAWGAAAPRMQALIPLILAIIIGVAWVDLNTDNIRHYTVGHSQAGRKPTP